MKEVSLAVCLMLLSTPALADDFNLRMQRSLDYFDTLGRDIARDKDIEEIEHKQRGIERRLQELEQRQDRYGPLLFDPRGGDHERYR